MDLIAEIHPHTRTTAMGQDSRPYFALLLGLPGAGAVMMISVSEFAARAAGLCGTGREPGDGGFGTAGGRTRVFTPG